MVFVCAVRSLRLGGITLNRIDLKHKKHRNDWKGEGKRKKRRRKRKRKEEKRKRKETVIRSPKSHTETDGIRNHETGNDLGPHILEKP